MLYLYRRDEYTKLAMASPNKIEGRVCYGEIAIGEIENKIAEQPNKYLIINDNGELEFVDNIAEDPQVAINNEIKELERFLRETDNYALRLASGEAKESDESTKFNCTFAVIMAKRTAARIKIKELGG